MIIRIIALTIYYPPLGITAVILPMQQATICYFIDNPFPWDD